MAKVGALTPPGQSDDKRASHRASLMLRRAKMVCHSGEYLCLIRDVSELGVGLGFLHDVPPEPRTLLKLCNDMTYPVERVWTGKRQAGYRFGSQVMLEEFLRENSQYQSRPLRMEFSAPVRVTEGRDRYDARLLDLSCEGAKIACSGDLAEGRMVSLDIEGLPPQLAQVRWSEGRRIGLKFHAAIDSEELANCALMHQPFDKTRSSGFTKLLAKARAA